MFRSIVIAATAASFAVVAVPAPASAQTAYQGLGAACNPATGLGPNGQPCKALVPLSNDRINAGSRIENVPTLNRSELAETFDCRDVDAAGGAGGNVVAYVEDCGTAAPAQLSNIQPYSGEIVAAPAPAPTPVAYTPPPPPAALPPAPPVYAPVQAAGLGNSIVPLALGAAGLAALVGIAIASDDDDDGNSSSATTTN